MKMKYWEGMNELEVINIYRHSQPSLPVKRMSLIREKEKENEPNMEDCTDDVWRQLAQLERNDIYIIEPKAIEKKNWVVPEVIVSHNRWLRGEKSCLVCRKEQGMYN